jgi:hypothetical protein
MEVHYCPRRPNQEQEALVTPVLEETGQGPACAILSVQSLWLVCLLRLNRAEHHVAEKHPANRGKLLLKCNVEARIQRVVAGDSAVAVERNNAAAAAGLARRITGRRCRLQEGSLVHGDLAALLTQRLVGF